MAETFLSSDGDVSVVIVAYRSPEALKACLASFETHRPARVREVIVIDNSADDGLAADIAHPWITYVRNAENLHFRRGVNQGARLATGRYLFILNPDTSLVDAGSIALLAGVLDERPEVAFVGPMVFAEDGHPAGQGENVAGLAYLVAEKLYLNAYWPRNPILRRHRRKGVSRMIAADVGTVTHAAVLVRRDEFLAVGGYDERAAAYWEEHEYGLKARRLGKHGHYLPQAQILHSWKQGGSQHVADRESAREFARSMRVYYRVAYGWSGGVFCDLLDALRLPLRAVARLARR